MTRVPASAPVRRPGAGALATRQRQSLRALLAFLTLSTAFPGLWATLAPGSFYTSFPLGGSGWVQLAGPDSAHLVADVGAFYLGFALLFAWAAWRPDRALVVPLCAAFSLFGVLHFAWHATHAGIATPGQAAEQLVSLGVVLATPVLTAVLATRIAAPGAPGAR